MPHRPPGLGKKRPSWARCTSPRPPGGALPHTNPLPVKRGSHACFRSFKDGPGLTAPRAQPAPPAGLRDTILGPNYPAFLRLPPTLHLILLSHAAGVSPSSASGNCCIHQGVREPWRRWGESNNPCLKGLPFSLQWV